MALNERDYLLIVNSLLDALMLKEQKKSQELIGEKLKQLNEVTFQCDAEIQKNFVKIIAKLKLAKKRMLYKADKVELNLKDSWILLSAKLDERIDLIKKEKAKHADSA